MAVPGKAWRTAMSILYLVSGLIALALLVYLFVALLKPEKFE
jgi:K+-transporting ATPase KdpF subunit